MLFCICALLDDREIFMKEKNFVDLNNIKKVYLTFNITILFFAVYIVMFPLVSKGLEIISPNLTKCIYREVTGKSCPLCGGTRYISNLKSAINNPKILLHPFGIIMIFVIINIAFRFFNIFYIRNSGKNIKRIIIYDFIILLIAAISFFTYEIIFLINQ